MKKYYAILDYGSSTDRAVVFSNSKAELLQLINIHITKQREAGMPLCHYEKVDLSEKNRWYRGVKLAHYISDDYALVTDSQNVFISDLINMNCKTIYRGCIGNTALKYGNCSYRPFNTSKNW